MKSEDYMRLVQRMNEVQQDDDAAVLVVMHGGEIKVSTYGEPRPLWGLKDWMFKWLGGRDEDKRGGAR